MAQSHINVAFWNLQNLFSPGPPIDEFLFSRRAAVNFHNDSWNMDAFNAKIKNLAEVIKLMHRGEMPDILGVCEVENRMVLEALVAELGRDDYEIVHEEGPDLRMIETALIFSKRVLERNGACSSHQVDTRFPTREILEVPLKLKREEGQEEVELMVLVNHWPARGAGRAESEPYRFVAGNICARVVDDWLKYPQHEFEQIRQMDIDDALVLYNNRLNRNVLVMGDFNDEPFNLSLLDHLRASSGTDKLEERFTQSEVRDWRDYKSEGVYLFNCMWRELGKPDHGSFFFSSQTNTMNVFDQLIVSRGLFYGESGLKMEVDSAEVFQPSIMKKGTKGRPKGFDEKRKNGYSDHFPVTGKITILN